MEKWLDIKGYEGLYQISDNGNIKSLPKPKRNKCGTAYITKERLMKGSPHNEGYLMLRLTKDGISKAFLIHRLVAFHFCEGYKKGYVVNHIDGNTLNNNATNLEWCTQLHNVIMGKLGVKYFGRTDGVKLFNDLKQ
jgi:hypothetical protein